MSDEKAALAQRLGLEEHTSGAERWFSAEGELILHLYFDPVLGLDTNDGRSEGEAVQTWGRLNALIQELNMSCVLHLRRTGVPV
jgi:hypothetical protein